MLFCCAMKTRIKVERGKLEVNLDVKSEQAAEGYALNTALFKQYFKELEQLRQELGMGKVDLMGSILRLPNVVGVGDEEVPEKEWATVLEAMNKALEQFDSFRAAEGGCDGRRSEDTNRKDFGFIEKVAINGGAAIDPISIKALAKCSGFCRQGKP